MAVDILPLAPKPDPLPVGRSRATVTVGPGALAPLGVFAAIFVAFGSPHSPSAMLAIALVGALGGAAALLAHECGHVLAARKVAGVHVRRIRLMAFGAATEFDGRYRTGRDQARVAAGGPAGSLGFAFLLVALAFLPLPGPVRMTLVAVAFLSVVIAVLCLLPVAPLDGYKIVVGVLWWLTGSESRARRLLRRIGAASLLLDLGGTSLLLFERPVLGSSAGALVAVLFVQKHVARRRRRQHGA